MYTGCANFLGVDFTYEWEYLLDATLTFDDYLLSKDDDSGGDAKSATTTRVLFTRVYIDDLDLMNKADDADEFQETAENNNNNNVPMVESAERPDSVNDSALSEGIAGRDEQRKLAAKKEFSIHEKRKKRMEMFKQKIACFSLVPGDLCQTLNFAQIPSGKKDLDRSSLPLSAVDVNFKHYASKHKSFKKAIRVRKKSLTAGSTSSSSSASPTPTPSDGVEQPKLVEEQPSAAKMSLEELRNFDFGYKPSRDRALVARKAKKYFAEDTVMMKYWYQRFRFFSKLNKGILMDREGWFSVTPEQVGRHVAERMVLLPDCTILDAFAGCGGNSIQFALRGAYVIAVDIDPVKLRCAARNAHLYGVRDRIQFVCANFFLFAASLFGTRRVKAASGGANSGEKSESGADASFRPPLPYPYGIDAVYMSPPWGGPAYASGSSADVFDLEKDLNPSGSRIFKVARCISPNIVLFLPKNSRTDQLIALAGPGGSVEVEQTMLVDKLRMLHAYYGDLAATSNS